MSLLPKKVGLFTLMRRLGSDGVTESFVAILDEPAGKQVATRKILPYILRDPARLSELEARVRDLEAARHPVLVPMLDYVAIGEDRFILDEWVDAVDLTQVIDWCRDNRESLPHNVYLNLATQICNGLEALHSRPGAVSGAEHVLHLALQPGAIKITPDGRVLVGDYGLTRSPTATPHSAGAATVRMEYLSPEQTHQDQTLAPASDIFSLGAILYELLTLKPMFKADSNLQTIHRVRRAEVTTQLLEVKEILPGLDKVLYRALSLNPRHRYQRAFVLREDLRGLMAGYSFANIADNTRDFLRPLFNRRNDQGTDEVLPALTGEDTQPETTASLLDASAAGDTSPAVPSLVTPASTGGLPVAFGDAYAPDESTDTAARLRRAEMLAHGTETRPENPLPTDSGALLRRVNHAQEPGPPSDFGDESVTDVREGALDQTGWVQRKLAEPETVGKPPTPPPAAPRARPAPVSVVDDDDDLDWRPKQSSPLPYVVGAAGVLLVLGSMVCLLGGGGALLMGSQSGSGGDDPVAVMATPTPAPSLPRLDPVDPVDPAVPKPAERPAPSATPRPERPAPSPRAERPAPTPRPIAAAAATPRPAPAIAPTPARPEPSSPVLAPVPAPPPTEADPEPTYAFEEAPTTPDVDDVPIEVDLSDLASFGDRAYRGALTDADRAALEGIAPADDDYTRAYTLLYQDARARNDVRGRETYIAMLMALPENQYRPELLVEEAELAIRARDYHQALSKAQLAERHWQRLPSDLIFTRKAMIFEIEASAWTGLFYNSEGEEADSLEKAIRGWEKYRLHVETKSRSDLSARADRQLLKLKDMQRRLE